MFISALLCVLGAFSFIGTLGAYECDGTVFVFGILAGIILFLAGLMTYFYVEAKGARKRCQK